MTMNPQPGPALTCKVPDLRPVRLADMPALAGDTVLETMLRRLQHEVVHPREAVSGFSSAI